MSRDKNPIEQAVDQALDAFVYAPIGLVFDGPALFPKLVEKGRTQVKVARMMGEMAVQMGQKEATKRVARTQGPSATRSVAVGVIAPQEAPPTPPTVDETTVSDRPVTGTATSTSTKAKPKTTAAGAAKRPRTGGPAPSPPSTPRAWPSPTTTACPPARWSSVCVAWLVPISTTCAPTRPPPGLARRS